MEARKIEREKMDNNLERIANSDLESLEKEVAKDHN